MTDGEHTESLRRWLADDLFVLNTVFLVAASSLAITLTSCLWHHIHPEPPSIDHDAPSVFSALSSFRVPAVHTVSSASQQQSLSTPTPEQKDHKSTRSKERRRRGKDPFRDLLKGGKRSKALLKAIKVADHDHLSPSIDTLSTLTAPTNDTSPSTSRSQSPEPIRDLLELDRCPDAESDDGSAMGAARDISTSSVASSSDINNRCSSDSYSWTHDTRPYSVFSDPNTSVDTQLNISPASTATGHASEGLPSPSVSTACANICTLQPRNSQAVSVSDSCAQLVRTRTRLRLSRMEPVVKSPPSSSTPALPDNVASSLACIHPNAPCPLVSIIPSTHSTDGAGPSTPTNSRQSTSPPRSLSPSEDVGQGERNTRPLNQNAISTQIQLASMHSALEAARLREEQLRVEAEQVSKERDEFRWRWSEDADLWRRRETELQAQIHYLMQQLQTYVSVASFQAHQAPNPSFSSPTSPHLYQHPFPLPPVIQTQNSASAPAHVQALLACAPMLTSHSPGFAAPASASLYSGSDHGVSSMSWSGVGLCIPKWDSRHGGRRTPDSLASGGSSSRGRQRERCNGDVRSASDESSLGDWDGIENGSGDEGPWDEEGEEDIFRNNALADAILKRPESIRELHGSVGKRSGMGRVPGGGRSCMHGTGKMGGGGIGERMDALKDPAEKHGFVPPLVDTQVAVRTVADSLDR